MKKIYTKPLIMFESFTLSTNIATGCDNITNTSSVDVCGYLDPRDPSRLFVFTTLITGCQRHQPDGYNGICYHNPSETMNLFNS